MTPHARRSLTIALSALLLAACGGGGGGGGGGDAAAPPAAPSVPVAACAVGDLATTTAAAVNALRSAAQSCGGVPYAAVGNVAWSPRLAQAATVHSSDMAANAFFNHTGSNGLGVDSRVGATGYVWTAVAENIAAGHGSLPAVLSGWMGSTGHCQNIMNAAMTEVGLACVKREGSGQTFYWTMVLARP